MAAFLALLAASAGFASAVVVRESVVTAESSAAAALAREWASARNAEAEDRGFWGSQWDRQEAELLQVQAAATVFGNVSTNATGNVSTNATEVKANASTALRKHAKSPIPADMNLNPKTPTDLLPTLAMLKALYAEGKERIASLNEREKTSKQEYERKEAEHKKRIAQIEEKVSSHKLSADFAANETRDENRLWSYWERVRQRQHRQFHTSLKIQHGTMEKEKQMIEMYEKAIAGTADKSEVKSELNKVAGGAAVPEVVFAQGAVLLQAGAFCAEALEEVRAARGELRDGSQAKFVCGQQTTIFTSSSANAAGTAEFSEITATDGVCVPQNNKKVTAVKFCGPGTLTLSRMQCGDHHDYKAMVVKHGSSEYTTNCEVISTADTVVEGWLGSFTLAC